MALIRVTNPADLRASHIVLLALIGLAFAGTFLLTSAAKPDILPDGAVEWDPDSVLLAVVELLNLQNNQPTPNGVAVKTLAHGIASALGVLIAALGLVIWAREEREVGAGDTVIDVDTGRPPAAAREGLTRRQLNPVRTAQALMLAYLLWSFASVTWSDAPQYAWGGAASLAIQAAWAYALGFGLNRRSAVLAGGFLVAALAVTSLLAIAYHAQRNPTLRASYPIGNPLFLATCLLPGLVIAVAALVGGGADLRAGVWARGALKIIACALALGVLLYATYLTRSRGPGIGLVVALVTLLLLAVGRRFRLPLALVALVGLVICAAYLFSQRFADSPTGRSTSMRVRFYAWPYALDLFGQQPLLGLGQAGYSLKADVFAVADVESDPGPLEYRIANAHNEWLEVAADLGTVGVVLCIAAIGLTLLAAVRALKDMHVRGERVMTIALIAALLGTFVAECFGVGLRFETVPLVYFTIIGLLWALAAPVPAGTLRLLSTSRVACIGCVAIASVACLVIGETSRRDFAAARAAHDVFDALETGEIDTAEQLAIRAYADRLNPNRKLAAHRLLAVVRLQIADLLQRQYGRRMQLAQTETGIEPRLRAEAERSRQASEQQIELGEAALADLIAVAPTFFQTGSLIHDFKHLRSIFAQIDGDPAAVAQHRLAAAVALRNELARRPFDPELAARYVIQDAPRLDHSEAFALLARPLRFRRPSSLYLEALDHLIARAGGPDAVLPTFDELADIPFEKDTIRWPSVYTPELLRLGAIVAFGHRDHERNIRYLTAALPYYELLGSDAALAHAACKAVLADARFHADPAKPSEAIADAQDALRLAPSSQDGRQLCDQIALRLVIYHLAADHEEHVRKIIRDRVRGLSEDDLDWEIAHQYVQLAYSLIESASAAVPDQLSRWSQRALELAPEAGLSWLLAGDLAIRAKVAERTAECARRALQFHADPKDVLGLLDRGVGAMPENTTLRQMRDALHARLQGEQPAADAQPPADTHPPADVPPLDTPIAEVGTPGVLATTNGL